MNTKKLIASMALALPVLCSSGAKAAEMDSLSQLACEAVLCLSTGDRPAECTASITHYFGIVMKKPWKTVQARQNFLKLCPDATEADVNKTVADSTQGGQTEPGLTPDDDPVPPGDTATTAPTPTNKAQVQESLATLRPLWTEKVAESMASRVTLEKCVEREGAVADGHCAAELADFNTKRQPAIILRDEITRLENLLAGM